MSNRTATWTDEERAVSLRLDQLIQKLDERPELLVRIVVRLRKRLAERKVRCSSKE